MTGSSANATQLPDDPVSARRGRLQQLRWLTGVAVLACVAFAASALLPGSHAGPRTRFGVARTAGPTQARDPLPQRITRVVGDSASAKRYGEVDALRENSGVNLRGQLISDLPPLPAGALRPAIARYRRYAERWSASFRASVLMLRARLRGGDRIGARHVWNAAFSAFMHLGADYNLLPAALTEQIAGIPSRLGERRFPGLHRIEMGLWTGEPLSTLLPVVTGLTRAAARLERLLPTVPIGTLAYTLRIHEILEDAQRDLLSGTEVPWSGAGVLGTEAGVIATRELLATVKPILEGRGNSYGESENWLDQLQGVLLSVRRADRGWPELQQLTVGQRERINGAMAGTLGALEQVPGALATREIAGFRPIPSTGGRRR